MLLSRELGNCAGLAIRLVIPVFGWPGYLILKPQLMLLVDARRVPCHLTLVLRSQGNLAYVTGFYVSTGNVIYLFYLFSTVVFNLST